VMTVCTILTPLNPLDLHGSEERAWWLIGLAIAAVGADAAFAPETSSFAKESRARLSFDRAAWRVFFCCVFRAALTVFLFVTAAHFSVRRDYAQSAILDHWSLWPQMSHVLVWVTLAGEVFAGLWMLCRLIIRQAAERPAVRSLMRQESNILIVALVGTDALVAPQLSIAGGLRGLAALYAFVVVSSLQRRLQPELRRTLREARSPRVHDWMMELSPANRAKHARTAEHRRRKSPYLAGILAAGALWVSYFAGFVSAGAQLISPAAPQAHQTSSIQAPHPALEDPPIPTASSASTPYYSQVCGGTPEDLPGWGASAADAAELRAQWLGSTSGATPADGMGAVLGGCPQPVQTVSADGATSTYQVGVQDGVVQSVAVTSPELGSTMFLSDGGAAQVARDLLEDGQPVGGSERTNVGNGDVQAIYTPTGTILLIRPIVHPTGQPTDSQPFVELTSSESSAWLHASQVLRAFLWPTTSTDASGSTTIALSRAPYGSPAALITQSTDTGAVLDIGGSSTWIAASRTPLAMATIVSLPVTSG
jgi:hypothetical protein